MWELSQSSVTTNPNPRGPRELFTQVKTLATMCPTAKCASAWPTMVTATLLPAVCTCYLVSPSTRQSKCFYEFTPRKMLEFGCNLQIMRTKKARKMWLVFSFSFAGSIISDTVIHSEKRTAEDMKQLNRSKGDRICASVQLRRLSEDEQWVSWGMVTEMIRQIWSIITSVFLACPQNCTGLQSS